MKWNITFIPEARKDMRRLDGSQSRAVARAIEKTQQNPLPRSEGGYGIELGNKAGVNLTNFLEIKLHEHNGLFLKFSGGGYFFS